MEFFNLPPTTRVNRVIPKNTFETYSSGKQKKLFTELIARISWLNKISSETVNLESKEIREIQVFRIELKANEDIRTLLDVIDRAIPYHIVFQVVYEGEVYVSTSVKHPHPINEDNAVIDWTFNSAWFPLEQTCPYQFQLKRSIDAVHSDFCRQIAGIKESDTVPVQELIAQNKQVTTLQKEIVRMQQGIANSKQFNEKVALNVRLKKVELELKMLSKQLKSN